MFLSLALLAFLCSLHFSLETCVLLGSVNFDVQLCCNGSSTELIFRPRNDAFVIISDSSFLQCYNETNQEIEILHLPEIFLFNEETLWIFNNDTRSCRLNLRYDEDHSTDLFQTATCGTCGIGYLDNGTACIDIDECDITPHICNTTHAQCKDIEGSFECICKEGFYSNGQICKDINECLEEMDDCDMHADCNNTEGSYECSCRDGFRGNGTYCEDIDECMEDSHECHDVRAQCINSIGSYTCTCSIGFTGNGTFCEDIDECCDGHNVCDIHAYCNNTDGSFLCMCRRGFIGNGIHCEHIKNASLEVEPDENVEPSESPSGIALGVSTVTAIIFGVFLVLSLCWVIIITLLFLRYLKHGYYNRQVQLGEYNNDKRFDEDFIPVEITCQASPSDSHLSIDTIIYPMEEVDTYTERDFTEPISDIQCDTSNSDNWIMSEAKQLGLQQEYLNIVDGHLDISAPQRWSSSTDQSHPDDTFDITSIS